MRYGIATLGALMAALLLSLPAYADDGDDGRGARDRKGKHRHGKRFERHDTNGDGRLTQDEVPARVWERISAADTDGDGGVTKDELKTHRKARREAKRGERGERVRDGKGGRGGKGRKGRRGRRGKRFDKADKNGDGQLTQDEVKPEVWQKISKADADGNGGVTKEELKAHRQEKRGGK